MRVAVDATSLLDTRTGVGNFTAAVIDGLAGRSDVDATAFPVSFRGHRRLRDAVPSGVSVATTALPARVARQAWLRADRPRIDRFIGSHDLVYGPNFVVPPSRTPRLATVHDLTSVHFPELCTSDTLQYPRLLRRAIADGAWIHTVSDAVRAEVVEHLCADPDRVVTVHNGFTPMSGGDAVAGRRLAGHDSFVLAVGTVEPRKDLPTLFRAIDLLAQDGRHIPLVHVGHDGWGVEGAETAHRAMSHPGSVTRLGRRSHEELVDLLAAARIFAYPSKYEGFGLPILEAMSAEVPVVASDIPAIREVAGDAATLVPTGDADRVAAAIDALWSDEAARGDHVSRGVVRASRFSWDRCVDGLVHVFHDVVADGPRR
ncbi:MAG: glycosyltransferase family 1 protein [Acidimicrobiales bacterium]|nr:glycosyltransferase family 1 protein [Acidimicrobiales bacterium]